ncbi:MAG: Gfo/Idh/MocA family oxidoreductase [Candidatus Hydrogenedentes bacterium]|nr:Gfo/Idh/MocA family oxidoreductase [Candidatus Hydrogenedentota bacterium]
MHLSRRGFLAASSGLAAAATAGGPPEKKYKACIIGDSTLGGYGHQIHNAFAFREDVAIVGLADPDEKGRARYGNEVGAARAYADYREMLDKERPDLVAIGPRTTVKHRDYLLACAEVGAHGFIEKPLCDRLDAGDEMIAAADAKNLKWAIAYNFRGMPLVQRAKNLVSEGLIGTVLEARGRGKEDHRAGGEDLIVLGTHVLDLMRFFMGASPEWCAADITVDGRAATPADVRDATEPLGPIVGDRVHAMYGFPGGAVGYFDSMKNPDGNGGRFGIDLYGSRGVLSIRIPKGDETVRVGWLDESSWAPVGKEATWRPLPDSPAVEPAIPPAARNRIITDDLIAAIEEDRRPAYSVHDGLASWEMIQAAFDACVQGGRVTLPLAARTHPLKRWG